MGPDTPKQPPNWNHLSKSDIGDPVTHPLQKKRKKQFICKLILMASAHCLAPLMAWFAARVGRQAPSSLWDIYLFRGKLNKTTGLAPPPPRLPLSDVFFGGGGQERKSRRPCFWRRVCVAGGIMWPSERRVNSACHFSFAFTCRPAGGGWEEMFGRQGFLFFFGQAVRHRTDWFAAGRRGGALWVQCRVIVPLNVNGK